MGAPLRELRSWRRVRVSLVRERADESYQIPSAIRSGADVAELVRAFLHDDPRETFIAIYLDGRHRPIAIHACSIGTAETAAVHPREVFSPALLCSASALIIAHNHPSGDATPSVEDREVTNRLREVGELLGIELLDHVIIGDERFYCFQDGAFHSWRKE